MVIMFGILSLKKYNSSSTESSSKGILLSVLMLVLLFVTILFVSPAAAEPIYSFGPSNTHVYDGDDHIIYPGTCNYNGNTDGIVLHVYSDGVELIPGSHYSIDVNHVKDARVYDITITFLNEYSSLTPLVAHYTVTKRVVTVDWKDSETTFTYDGEEQSYSAVLGNIIPGDDVSPVYETGSDSGKEVGTYTTKIIDLSGADAENYQLPSDDESKSITWQILPQPLTVYANNISIVYGSPVPEFTARYVGFVDGESVADLGGKLTFSTDYEQYKPVGLYNVTPSGFSSTHYSIVYVPGTLEVQPKELILSGDILPQNKEYDGTTKVILKGSNSADLFFAFLAPKSDGKVKVALDESEVAFSGVVNNDDIAIDITGEFQDSNIGQNIPVILTPLISGASAGNYQIQLKGLYSADILPQQGTDNPEGDGPEKDNPEGDDPKKDNPEGDDSKKDNSGSDDPKQEGSKGSSHQSVWAIPTYIPISDPTPVPISEPVSDPQDVVEPAVNALSLWDILLPILLILGIIVLLLLLLLLFMRRSEVLAIAYVIRKNAKAAQISYLFGDSVNVARIIKKTVTASDEFRGWVHLPPRYSAAGEKILDILKIEHYPLPSLALAGDILSVAERFHKKDHN